MSTYTSEPGTRLAGRYRLVDQVGEGAGWTFWKATDEALARSITVLTFAPGFARVTETVTAARAVSRLGDPRFSQVFDVEDADEAAYVVLEWVVGESLLDMLAEGPLDPARAAALVTEAARAIAGAHAAGLAHLRLDPARVHWTAGGGVKIAGLGIDAALAGPVPEPVTEADDGDPELADTRDLARLLYAALTGYWPGQPESAGLSGLSGLTPGLLPPAPESDGIPCTPRQVSAGVPAGVDDVTCRALFQRPNRHGPALSTAAAFADALASAAPPLPLPFSPVTGPVLPPGQGRRPAAGGPDARDTAPGYHPGGSTSPYPQPGGGPRSRARGRRPSGRHSPAARIVISAVIALVLAAVGVAAWTASHGPRRAATPTPARLRPSAPAAAAAVQLKPASASSFDPLGSGGGEDPDGARFAIDGDPATAWHTSYYLGSPLFGGLPKKGTGLLLDMGKQVRLSQVTVQFGPTCCTRAEIEIGNDAAPSAATLSTFTPLQGSATAAGDTTFTVTKPATGRYVLIWITLLPPLEGSQGKYEAFIYNVVVRGFTAGQSS